MKKKLTLEEQRERCKRDRIYLAREVLGYDLVSEGTRFLPDGREVGTIHQQMADFMALHSPPGKATGRTLLLLPRGHLKTTLITVTGVIQDLINDPDIRIVIGSVGMGNAAKMLGEIRQHCERNDLLLKLFPHLRRGKGVWTNKAFTVEGRQRYAREASVTAVGTDQPLASAHYDKGYLDDVTDDTTTTTSAQRAKNWRWLQKFYPLLQHPRRSPVVMVGTRWHDGDCYAKILAGEAQRIKQGLEPMYEIMCVSIIEQDANKQPYMAWPEEFSFDDAEQLQATDPELYSAIYMNDPKHGSSAHFSAELIDGATIQRDKCPSEYAYYIASYDPAGSTSSTADYNVICVCGVTHNGHAILVDVIRGRWSPTETMEQIKLVFEAYNPQPFLIEEVAFQHWVRHAFELEQQLQAARGHAPATPAWVPVKRTPGERKTLRIQSLEIWMRNARLRLADDCPYIDVLRDELCRLGIAEHDDIADALSDIPKWLWTRQEKAVPIPEAKPGTMAWELKRLQHKTNRRLPSFRGRGRTF